MRRANEILRPLRRFCVGGARPQTRVLIDCFTTYQSRFGVEPICAALAEHGVQIAPSTYYAYTARGFKPTDAELIDAYAANALHRLWVKSRHLYGAGSCGRPPGGPTTTVAVGAVGGRSPASAGVRRGRRRTITTEQDEKAPRHPDHIKRRWNQPMRPDQWWRTLHRYGRRPGSISSRSSPTCTRGGSWAGA